MNGYLHFIEINTSYFFEYNEFTLTVYSNNSRTLTEQAKQLYNTVTTEKKYAIGSNIEESINYIFFINQYPFENKLFKALQGKETINVAYYIELNAYISNFSINRINFSSPELDYIFCVNSRIEKHVDVDQKTINIQTLPYNTSKERFSFCLKREKINCEFGVNTSLSFKSNTPLTLSCTLSCEMGNTTNLDTLFEICSIIKSFLIFICNRKNIFYNSIKIFGIDEESNKFNLGKIHLKVESSESSDILCESVDIRYFKSCLSELFNLISQQKLYLDHIPLNYQEQKNITVAREIMDFFAFECNYKICFGDRIPSEDRLRVKSDVLSKLNDIGDNYNRNEKKCLGLYKSFTRHYDFSLSEKIKFSCNVFRNILSDINKYIYRINDKEEDTFSKISRRLEIYRNNYAHGNINIEKGKYFISDILLLEWLNYCMILKYCGYNEIEIYNLIVKIFRISLPEKNMQEQ